MYRYSIAKSRHKSYEVYVNLISSPAGSYISRNPHTLNLIREALESLKLTGPEISIERNMGRVIGNTDIVNTSDKDAVFYAQAHKKDVFSRYVKNRSLSPSTNLTIILTRYEDGNYELTDTWIGPHMPPFPGDAKATKQSKSYWETHALVMDAQLIQSKTITKVCPY